MLILIAGVTGNMGQRLARFGLEKGHSIRGFGRSPSKLPEPLSSRLESFVQCDDYTDRTALDRAVAGVDAVICTYTSDATAILDAQLPLFRATECAGVKIYHAHTWNCDWTKTKFGDWEHYDACKSFRRQVDLTSALKPVYVFTGILGEFATNNRVGIAHVREESNGEKVLAYWGDGTAKWDFTYFEDAARFSIELITTNPRVLAGEGGDFHIRSGEANAMDLVRVYEKKAGRKVEQKSLGGLEELRASYQRAKETEDPRKYFIYSGYYIQAVNIEGTWKMNSPQEVGSADAVEQLFERAIGTPVEFD